MPSYTGKNKQTNLLEYIANRDSMLGHALSWNIIVGMTEDL